MTLATATPPCLAESATKPADPNIFTSKKDGFSITAPATWEKRESQGGLAVVFREPLQDAADTFHENVKVAVEKLPAGVDLDAYVKPSLETAGTRLSQLKVNSSQKVKLGKLMAQRVVLQHKPGTQGMTVLSYLIVSGGRGYTLTCASTVDQFASHEKIFEDTCKTFQTFEADMPMPQPFRSEKDGFSITGPAGWEQVESKPPVGVMFAEPQVTASDTLRENLNVRVEKLPAWMDLDAYFKARIKALPEMVEEFKLISSKSASLGKLKAQRVVLQHKDRGRDFKVLCYILVSGGRGYSINCATTLDQYEKYEPIFEDICKTFQTFETTAPNPQPFTSKEAGFTIIGPADWEEQHGVDGTVVQFARPSASQSDKFRETINVAVEDLKAGTTLREYVMACPAAMAKQHAEFKLLTAVPSGIGSVNAHRFMYKHKTVDGYCITLACVAVANGRGYILSWTSKEISFSKSMSAFGRICDTFRILSPSKSQ